MIPSASFLTSLAAILLGLIGVAAPSSAAAQNAVPLSRAEILSYLRTQVTHYGVDWQKHQEDIFRLCSLVEKRGVDFTYGEGTPNGFDQEMHSAAGGTAGRSASGQGCNLTYLIETNRRSSATVPSSPPPAQPPSPPAKPTRPRSDDPPTRADPAPARSVAYPRLATYYVLTYGDVSRPLRIGTFELLGNGRYRVHLNGGKPAGEGQYRFDPREGTIQWISGPYQTFGSSGFSVIREGKTHRIQLNRTTIGFNDAP